MKKIPIGILGATGNVGQRFVQLLSDHPWFVIKSVCASEKSVGKLYKDTCDWRVSESIPDSVANLVVQPCDLSISPRILFSALDSSVAGEIEKNLSENGYVIISNSKNHRMDLDVPLLIPEVNSNHLSLIKFQQKKLGRKSGFIVTNPNCSTVGLAIVLKPLQDNFGIKNVIVTTMQALSGAGYPGVASLDALDNVVPYIGDEEEKVETEPLKILGEEKNGKINYANFKISAQCNRVSVRDGHLESVEIEFVKKSTVPGVIKVLKEFTGLPQKLNLPSAPKFPIIVRAENNRPQPILDRDADNGMAVTVGRVRESSIFNIKFSLLVHNTIRGAAGAAILNAELMKAKNII